MGFRETVDIYLGWSVWEEGGETWEQRLKKIRKQGNKNNFGEQGRYKTKILVFGKQGNKAIYLRGTRLPA